MWFMDYNKEQGRLIELQTQLRLHNYRYYILNDPTISDYEWDQAYRELLELEEKYPDLKTPDSPTQRAGTQPSDAFGRIQHPAPILSLDNAFSREEIQAWYERVLKLDDRVVSTKFTLEPKLDGLTVVLHYENGILTPWCNQG